MKKFPQSFNNDSKLLKEEIHSIRARIVAHLSIKPEENQLLVEKRLRHISIEAAKIIDKTLKFLINVCAQDNAKAADLQKIIHIIEALETNSKDRLDWSNDPIFEPHAHSVLNTLATIPSNQDTVTLSHALEAYGYQKPQTRQELKLLRQTTLPTDKQSLLDAHQDKMLHVQNLVANRNTINQSFEKNRLNN